MPSSADPNLTSVIIVSHHSGPGLDLAVESVLAQTAPVELIIVNNGNAPDVETRLAARAGTEPRLQLLTGHGDVGFAKGCNLGARAAHGGFFLFLQADGLLPSDAVSRLRDLVIRSKQPCLLGTRLVNKKGKDHPAARQEILTPLRAFVHFLELAQTFPAYRLAIPEEPLPPSPVAVPAISGSFAYLAAKEFWRHKGFDERYATTLAVMDFCLRLRRAEGKIYFIPGIEVRMETAADCAQILLHEAKGVKDGILYFHENFGHAWTQPLLWLLYAVLWVRRELWVVRKRLTHID